MPFPDTSVWPSLPSADRIPGCVRLTIPPLATAALTLRVIRYSIHSRSPDGTVACHTCATARRTTSPILVRHSPKRFAHSLVRRGHGSPPDAIGPAHYDASPDSAVRDRFVPAALAFVRPGGHLFAGSW